MTVVWDTTQLSRVRPGGDLERELLERARDDDHVAVTAPTIMEVTRGLAARAQDGARWQVALRWFVTMTASGLLTTLPLDRRSALLAGRLRAEHPMPPATARKRSGTKPEQRAGWVIDIQIAACAWRHGCDVTTDNMRDFEALRDAIEQLHPDQSPLVVRAP
jgi:predicted nucleic acid-binding protein